MRRPVRWSALVVFAALLLVPAIALAGGDGEFSDYEARGLGWMYVASFGFGFLTSLTPCVYPMIPITLAIFGARGADVSKRRAILLATAYVFGMGVTYAVLGVTVALVSGASGFGTQLGHPAVVLPLVALFLVLAASMFGAFELNLPSGLQAKLNQIGGKGFGGAFAMGLVGGLIAAPCTGPFLAGLLAYVSTTGSVVSGGSLLFVYAIGMGVLFWVLAAFAMSLPKSGAWMEKVKSIGGIALLWAALYFLRPLVSELRMFASPELWFLLACIGVVVAGLALGAVRLSFHGNLAEKLRKGVAVALVVGGAYAAWDWKLTPKQHLPWIHGNEIAAFEQARAQGKGVMVDFSATWCGPCEELELTFGDDAVYEAITGSFVPLKFDVTEGTDQDDERKARYQAGTLPAVVFVDSEGNRLAHIKNMMDADTMLPIVKRAAKKLPTAPATPTPTPSPAPPPAPKKAASLPWLEGDEAAAFAQARAQGKGVMIAFAATWAVPSEELERTFARPAVADAVTAGFVPLRFDVSAATEQDVERQARYGVQTLPSVIFIDAGGNRLEHLTRVVAEDELLGIVRAAGAKLRAGAVASGSVGAK